MASRIVKPEEVKRDLIGFIFTYDRPDSLCNAVQSWENNAPDVRLVIVDDGSTDEGACRVLECHSERYEVWRKTERRKDRRKRHGGLYRNMQAALEYAAHEGYRFAFFAQDDTQIVRRLEPLDYWQIGEAFSKQANAAQLSVRFKGEAVREAAGEYFEVCMERPLFDVGIMNVKLLQAQQWRFADNEMRNIQRARENGMCRVEMPDPILAHTPWPKTLRNGRRPWFSRLTDWWVGAGVHRFRHMTRDEVRVLRRRRRDDFPVAEQWLNLEADVRRPWKYGNSEEELWKEGKKRIIRLLEVRKL